jgi:hypothetical protein
MFSNVRQIVDELKKKEKKENKEGIPLYRSKVY